MRRLSIGIVGLPNVGKSTLFNAITNSEIPAQNYPFCTIEPNVGIVMVPDPRLQILADISGTEKIINAAIEFVDIAGLVKGAAKGEGLGNQFLATIGETSAIAHVVRCFEDPDVIHVDGKIDPLADISVVNAELLLADLDRVEKIISTQEKKTKTNDKTEVERLAVLIRIKEALSAEIPVRHIDLSEQEKFLLKSYHFLTQKPVIYVANVNENDLKTGNDYVNQVKEFATEKGDTCVCVSAKIEEELSELSETEQLAFLKELGVSQSGLERLSISAFSLLGLQTYLTTGQKETRAWTIKQGMTAPQAAGVIHTDFEKGFICAEVISYTDFVANNGWKSAKDKGIIRQEGKDYLMKDGDVVEFRFNV